MTKLQLALIPSLAFAFGLFGAACSGENDNRSTSSGSGGASMSGGASTSGGSGAIANAGSSGSGAGDNGGASGGAGTSGNGGSSGSAGAVAGGATSGSGGAAGASGANGDSGNGGQTSGGVGGSSAGSGGAAGGSAAPEPTLITSGKGDYWKVGEVKEGGSSATVTVNASKTYQTWHGFGGTFNEKGWEALSVLSDADRARAMQLLFDVEDGAGFTWGRIPIGASDYASDRYTLNDNAGDLAMEKFSIERDKQKLIPFIRAAQAVKSDIKFWGSPWTPPPWMKDNGMYDKGAMKSDKENLDAYALYLVKFVQEYAKEGIKIDHVQPQNEPGWSQSYPSCAWGPSTDNNVTTNRTAFLGQFVVDNLAPAIKTAGLDTKIWYGTLSNDGTFKAYWENLSDAGRKLVTGVALQWGTASHVAEVAATGLLVMQSEHKCGNYPWLDAKASSVETANRDNFLASTAPNNHAYAEESWDLIKDWIVKGVNVYSAWNMVLDTKGFSMDTVRPWPQNALITVDTAAKKLIPTPAYYVFRHVAQYVEPGAVRVDVNGDALAFKNPDGSIVTIIYNSGAAEKATTLSVAGKMLQFNIPSHGWATVNWHG